MKYVIYNKENGMIGETEAKTALYAIEKLVGRELTDKEVDSYTDTEYGKKITVDGQVLRTYKISKTMSGNF